MAEVEEGTEKDEFYNGSPQKNVAVTEKGIGARTFDHEVRTPFFDWAETTLHGWPQGETSHTARRFMSHENLW